MTDALVKFDAGHDEPNGLGNEKTFSFQCPMYDRRCGDLLIAGRNPGIKRDGQGKNGGAPMWEWDGNLTAPTFHPSIDCKGCWHGYIIKGRCVSVQKQDEPKRYEPK